MNDFNFYVGFDEETEDIIKSSAKHKGSKRYDKMILKGLASDNSKDKQGETLEPSGYQIEDFLSDGLINLEHYTSRKGDSQYWIGEPTDAIVKGDEFYIESKLWKSHPLARNFWDTLVIMKESGSTRKAGYSIEGKRLELDPNDKKRVTKANITNCAVTMSPVNKNSWIEIVKGEYSEPYIPVKYENETFLYRFEKGGDLYKVMPDFSVRKERDLSLLKKAILDGKINLKYLPQILKKLY